MLSELKLLPYCIPELSPMPGTQWNGKEGSNEERERRKKEGGRERGREEI